MKPWVQAPGPSLGPYIYDAFRVSVGIVVFGSHNERGNCPKRPNVS